MAASPSLLSTLASIIVRTPAGAIDQERTANAVVSALLAEEEAVRETDKKIEVQLDAIFDRFPPGLCIQKSTVAGTVVQCLIPNGLGALERMESHNYWADKVESFLERTDRFDCKRGKGGGLRRIG